MILTLLLTSPSAGSKLSPEDVSFEGRSHLQDTKTPLERPSSLQFPDIQTPLLSPLEERTLQKEFLLQQFIHRLTTTPHQTILRTQVCQDTTGTGTGTGTGNGNGNGTTLSRSVKKMYDQHPRIGRTTYCNCFLPFSQNTPILENHFSSKFFIIIIRTQIQPAYSVIVDLAVPPLLRP